MCLIFVNRDKYNLLACISKYSSELWLCETGVISSVAPNNTVFTYVASRSPKFSIFRTNVIPIYVRGKGSTMLRNVAKFLREYTVSKSPQKDNILCGPNF